MSAKTRLFVARAESLAIRRRGVACPVLSLSTHHTEVAPIWDVRGTRDVSV